MMSDMQNMPKTKIPLTIRHHYNLFHPHLSKLYRLPFDIIIKPVLCNIRFRLVCVADFREHYLILANWAQVCILLYECVLINALSIALYWWVSFINMLLLILVQLPLINFSIFFNRVYACIILSFLNWGSAQKLPEAAKIHIHRIPFHCIEIFHLSSSFWKMFLRDFSEDRCIGFCDWWQCDFTSGLFERLPRFDALTSHKSLVFSF